MLSLLSRTTPRARKPYHCDACGQRIEQGCVYVREGYVAACRAYTLRMHEECDRVVSWGIAHFGCDDDGVDVADMYWEALGEMREVGAC